VTTLVPAPLLAPNARAVRLVNLSRRKQDTERWRVEADGVHVGTFEIALEVGWRSGVRCRLFTPDIPSDLLSPRFLGESLVDRGSPWWTPDVLRDVFKVLVRERIAPAATVEIVGVPVLPAEPSPPSP
jgi:hypothetical protein